MLGFMLGLMIGGFIGIITMSIICAAARSDEQMPGNNSNKEL